MILLIDNFDSFTHILADLIKSCYKGEVVVIRENEVDATYLKNLNPKAIIISPGPGSPEEAKNSLMAIGFAIENKLPLLGVCLGHQAIGYYFGGTVLRGSYPIHGKVHEINNKDSGLFKFLPSNFMVTRYHSLVIANENFPEVLNIDSVTNDNVIMGISHKELPIFGVQFHPESACSEYGKEIVENFLEFV